MTIDHPRVEAAVREILAGIGEDPDRDGLQDTPARVARMYAEVFEGLDQDAREPLSTTFDIDHQELVLVRDIGFHSMCEHHLLPFVGTAHVGYIPDGGVVTGLSKLARLVNVYARRPQVQERLTFQIADALMSELGAAGAIVRDRGGAHVHVDAGRARRGRPHGHERGARHAARQFQHPGRGHEPHQPGVTP